MNKRFKRYQKLLAVSLATMSCAGEKTSGSENNSENNGVIISNIFNTKNNEYIKKTKEKLEKELSTLQKNPKKPTKTERDYHVLLSDFNREVGLHRTMDKWYNTLTQLTKEGNIPYTQGLAWLCTICFEENVEPQDVDQAKIKRLAEILKNVAEHGGETYEIVNEWITKKKTKELLNIADKLINEFPENDPFVDEKRMLETAKKELYEGDLGPMVGSLCTICNAKCIRIPCLKPTVRSVFSMLMSNTNTKNEATILANAIITELDKMTAPDEKISEKMTAPDEEISENPFYNYLMDF